MDLSKQQALDADPRAMQQIYFTGNLDQAGNTRSKKRKKKKTFLIFSQGTVRVLSIYFALI